METWYVVGNETRVNPILSNILAGEFLERLVAPDYDEASMDLVRIEWSFALGDVRIALFVVRVVNLLHLLPPLLVMKSGESGFILPQTGVTNPLCGFLYPLVSQLILMNPGVFTNQEEEVLRVVLPKPLEIDN